MSVLARTAAPVADERGAAEDSHRLPGIEVLRAIAALSVVCTHVDALSDLTTYHRVWWDLGTLGVDVFFVLSSFLLCEYFWRPAHQRSFRVFYLRRFLRIAPAYYVVITILFLFVADHTLMFSALGVKQVLASGTFLHYVFPVTASSLNLDGALWTLTIEMMLYAALPLMALAVWRRPVLATLLLVGISAAYRLYIAQSAAPLRDWLFSPDTTGNEGGIRLYLARQFIGFVSVFMVGIIVRYLVVRGRVPAMLTRTLRAQSALVIVALMLLPAAVTVATVERVNDYQHRVYFTFGDLAIVVAAVPALLYASRPVAGRLSPLMRAGVWLGRRSYGIYLWHFPIILAVYEMGTLAAPAHTTYPLLRVSLILGVTILFASVSYSLVERPAMDLARRVGRRWVAGSASTDRRGFGRSPVPPGAI